MIKTNTLNLAMLLVFVFLVIMPINAEITVIKLSYANPDSIITTLKSLFGRKLEISSAPMINAIVVRTKDMKVLTGIRNLIKSLDRRPSTLRFSMKSITSSDFRNRSISITNNSEALQHDNRKTRSNGQAIHSVTVIEFQKAGLTSSISRVVPMGWQGTTTFTATRGLQISGHLANSNTVIVNLWFSSGSFSDASTLMTTVKAPLGHWFQIGTHSRQGSTNPSPEISANNSSIKVTLQDKKTMTEQYFLIKVDLIQSY